jgi:hypothetical protein
MQGTAASPIVISMLAYRWTHFRAWLSFDHPSAAGRVEPKEPYAYNERCAFPRNEPTKHQARTGKSAATDTHADTAVA